MLTDTVDYQVDLVLVERRSCDSWLLMLWNVNEEILWWHKRIPEV